MTDGPLVSVVTPVHNGGSHVRECIESVLDQSYVRFEYLIVDNESTDDTLSIAREYEKLDERITVLAPDGFVSADANANRALSAISPNAEYVKIVHADDWLFHDCVERMVELALAHPRVGVVSSYRLEGDRVDLVGLPRSTTVLPGREAARSLLLGGPLPYMFGSPTSVLLAAYEVRRRPEFYSLDNPHQSDQEVCLDILRTRDFGFVHDVLTFTRRHEGAESPFYVRVGAQYPCRLRLLTKHGGSHLSTGEYRRKLAVRVAEYAGFVFRNGLRLADRRFRTYHLSEATALVERISLRDVLLGVAYQVLPRPVRLRLAGYRCVPRASTCVEPALAIGSRKAGRGADTVAAITRKRRAR